MATESVSGARRWEVRREKYYSASGTLSHLSDALADGWEPFAATCDAEFADYIFLRRLVPAAVSGGAAEQEQT